MPRLDTTEIIDFFCSPPAAAAQTSTGTNGNTPSFIRLKQEGLMAQDYDRPSAFLIVAAFQNAAFKVRKNSLSRLSRVFEGLKEDEIQLTYDPLNGPMLNVRQTCMTDQPFRTALRRQFRSEIETLNSAQVTPPRSGSQVTVLSIQ